MNITMLLDMAADAFGERTAVVCGNRSLTYAELRHQAQRAAVRIRASGARYLALLDVNSPVMPVAIYAAGYAGIPYVPLNYRLTRDEINALLERVNPALLVVGDAYRELVQPSAGLELISSQEFVQQPAVAFTEIEVDPASVAVQLFTSGTTGKPKAAILRNENLISYIVGTVEFAAAQEQDAVLVTVPPYHIAGISAVLSSTYACRRMVQLENFDPQQWLRAAQDEMVSNAFLVPTMLGRVMDSMAQSRDPIELPNLRAIAYGGGKMPLATIQKAMELLPQVDFTNAYGLTETSSTVAVLTPDDHRLAAASDDPQVRKRLSSVGQPTGAVEIEIRDAAGQVLGTDQPGMIFVRGGQVSGEYQEMGSTLSDDGWFCTKDLGYLDADGYLFLEGREDDVIVRGGENISPGEIEDVLIGHPAVADAAVVAIADEQWGEGVAAAVVLEAGQQVSAEELQALVKSALRSSRVPQQIVFKPELPYNELGKILRRVIRQEFAEQQEVSA